MRGTSKRTREVYGVLWSYAYQDTDYDTTDTYTITVNRILWGIMCSHGTPDLKVYDGTAYRAVDDPAGNPIGAGTADEMMVTGGISGETTGQVGELRISSPGINNTTLTLCISASTYVSL